jgi:hypothetical protein
VRSVDTANGSSILIRGSGYLATSEVTVTIGSNQLPVRATVRADGTFEASITILESTTSTQPFTIVGIARNNETITRAGTVNVRGVTIANLDAAAPIEDPAAIAFTGSNPTRTVDVAIGFLFVGGSLLLHGRRTNRLANRLTNRLTNRRTN